ILRVAVLILNVVRILVLQFLARIALVNLAASIFTRCRIQRALIALLIELGLLAVLSGGGIQSVIRRTVLTIGVFIDRLRAGAGGIQLRAVWILRVRILAVRAGHHV